MSDPTLTLGQDGGDLILSEGDLLVGNGLESAVVLSLNGGNQSDSGNQSDNARQWWANALYTEGDPRRLRSRTQHLLATLPATSSNVLRVQEAVELDLAWMVPSVASSIDVRVSLTSPKRVTIEGDAIVNDEAVPFSLTQEWGGDL